MTSQCSPGSVRNKNIRIYTYIYIIYQGTYTWNIRLETRGVFHLFYFIVFVAMIEKTKNKPTVVVPFYFCPSKPYHLGRMNLRHVSLLTPQGFGYAAPPHPTSVPFHTRKVHKVIALKKVALESRMDTSPPAEREGLEGEREKRPHE